jgi:hypothetical protein
MQFIGFSSPSYIYTGRIPQGREIAQQEVRVRHQTENGQGFAPHEPESRKGPQHIYYSIVSPAIASTTAAI